MPHLSEAEFFAQIALELFREPPLPLDDFLHDPLVRLRVGITISESVTHPPPESSWPTHALRALRRAHRVATAAA
jgi:hypothetical protein